MLDSVAERKTSDERRDDIVRATLRLVARKGFAGVTLREVATEVGVVHGLLRHYFSSRDELVAAAFDAAVSNRPGARFGPQAIRRRWTSPWPAAWAGPMGLICRHLSTGGAWWWAATTAIHRRRYSRPPWKDCATPAVK